MAQPSFPTPAEDPLLAELPRVQGHPTLARRWQLLRCLGRGGMGVVYLARHTTLGQLAAVKCLRPEYAEDRGFLSRFRREAQVAARIHHAHMVGVRDFDDQGPLVHLVLEFIEGRTLRRLLREEGPLELAQALRLTQEIAAGLAAAHAAEIIHRDLKPDNVLVDASGRARVTDLGLAKDLGQQRTDLTVAGTRGGTPGYMSPEQWTALALADQRSDVWALGATLYFLLVGKDAIPADELAESRTVDLPFPDPCALVPGLPRSAGLLVRRLTSSNPEDRPQDAGEALELLASLTPAILRAAEVRAQPEARCPAGWSVRDAQPPPGAAAQEPGPARKAGWAWRVVEPQSGASFLLVEPGEFELGSPPEEGEADERPRRRVILTRPFYLAEAPLTQAQWVRLEGANPSRFQDDSLPVERISWEDCVRVCARYELRLPTEAEWEYACRAGTNTTWSTGAALGADQANVAPPGAEDDPALKTTPSGSFPPNPWGLLDMHGNVWEWCSDVYDAHYYSSAAPVDPRNPHGGERRVLRGGCFRQEANAARSAQRGHAREAFAAAGIGLRPVRSLRAWGIDAD